MMATILKFALSVVLAVAGSMAGQRWITYLYASAPDILDKPYRVAENTKKRQSFLTMSLGFLLCFASLQGDYSTVSAWLSAMIVIYFCVLFSATDWEQHVIFDRMLIPFAVLGLLFTLLSGGLLNHILAAAAGGIVFLLLSILTKGGIGGGDIKLIAALGLWLGTDQLLTVACTGMILGGVAALLLLVTKRRKRGEMFAYGPYFTVAALVLALI